MLKDIDLVFPSRKFVTLLGPSGCGKTTLLRMIAGLEPVTAGAIRFGDRVVNDLAPRDRNIAMVFQSYALYPQMTVRRNLGYGLRVRKTPKAEMDAAVERVAGILEIGHLLDRKPGQLSGGQRQRVALGRAMVRQPDIFLMDEPLSNLDAKLRVTMRAELRRFHIDLSATTIYVTHDQLEAMTMSDMIAVMHGGIVQQFGTPAEVYGRPANLFVAGFIGSPPMNFVTGTLGGGGQPAFASPDFTLALPGGATTGADRAGSRAGGQAAGPHIGARRHGARDGAGPRLGGGTARIGETGRGHAGRAPPHDRAGAGRYGRENRRCRGRAARSTARASVRRQERRRTARVRRYTTD